MSKHYTQRNCPGCMANHQKILILENRVKYLEQHMMTRSSTPRSRPRSKSGNRRKYKSPNPKNRKQNPPPKAQNQDQLSQKMSGLQVSTLPLYVPPPQVVIESQLNPIAIPFKPTGYIEKETNQFGPDGGASGYQ